MRPGVQLIIIDAAGIDFTSLLNIRNGRKTDVGWNGREPSIWEPSAAAIQVGNRCNRVVGALSEWARLTDGEYLREVCGVDRFNQQGIGA